MRLRGIVIGLILLAAPVLAADEPNVVGTVSIIKALPAKLSENDKADLNRVAAYLGAIKTIKASFSQVSPDGNVSNGAFYLQRPGKFRMEYEPPTPVLVVTNGKNIIYFDKQLDQVTQIPLDSSLVGFLTRDKIRFDDTVTVTRFEHAHQSLRISLVETKRPSDGTLTIEFSDAPLTLRNIIMTNNAGDSTSVSLADTHFGEPLDASLFVFKDPHPEGKRYIQK